LDITGAVPVAEPISDKPDDQRSLAGKWQFAFQGEHKVIVDEVMGITAGPRPGTKIVTAKLRSKIANACFAEPSFLYAVHRSGGSGTREIDFGFQKYDDGWRYGGIAWGFR
jgi:hypothetical protein